MSFAVFDELARDWLLPPAPLADDAVAPEFDPRAAIARAEDGQAKRAFMSMRERTETPWRFLDFAVRPGMSVAEALFWLRVAADVDVDGTGRIRWQFSADEALRRYPETRPSHAELESMVQRAMNHGGEAVGAWLLPLIGLRQVVEWFISGKLVELANKAGNWNFFFLEWLGHKLPTLVTHAEWCATLKSLDEHLDEKAWYATQTPGWGTHRKVLPAWKIAVYLGHTEALRRLVESWPDDIWQSSEWLGECGLFFVCGVRDPEFSLQHLVRLKLKPDYAPQAGIWLLHTQEKLVGPVLDLARRVRSNDEARAIVGYLGAVKSDRIIRGMLLLAESDGLVKATADRWLDEHLDRAVSSCVAIVGEGGAQAEMARERLRRAWAGPRRVEVERLAQAATNGQLSALVAEWARVESDEIRPDEMPAQTKVAGRTKPLPGWLRMETLASLKRDARLLGMDGARMLLLALRNGGYASGAAAWARGYFSAESREAFWQSLIVAWCLAGTGKKDNWCMDVAVALRGPSTAANLGRFIATWPAESQHQKAALGLEALRAMGDAPALQALVGISQRTRFAGLRSRATACVAEIAAELGLTMEELADTSVPTCGLDQDGRIKLDFGTRRFVGELGRGAEPVLATEDGRRLKTLPKPSVSDPAEQAAFAASEWKVFKKTLAETVKAQRARLESALVAGRRWKTLNFQRYVAAHPVMRRLAETLVWGVFDSEGIARDFFTVRGGDGALVTAEGEIRKPFSAEDAIGLAHPIQLSAAALEQWRTWSAAQGTEQSIPQLWRETESVEKDEAGATVLAEFANREISGATLRRRMDTMAWRRGVPVEAGLYYEYSMCFPAAEATAVVETSGQPVVTDYDDGKVTVLRVFFVAGSYEPVEYAKHPHALELGLVDEVAFSETVRALRLALRPTKA